MGSWNINDLENSKPSWLTEEQKRQCIRTVRGWEIPLAGCGFTNTAENIFGATANGTTAVQFLYRSPNFVGPTELLVALPLDPSVTGVTNTNYAGNVYGEPRGLTSIYGATSGDDVPNYRPYFTAPVAGITNTSSSTVIFATRGITSYIPVIAADANMTDVPRRYSFGLTTSNGQSLTGVSLTFGAGFTSGYFASLYNTIGATSTTPMLTGPSLTTRQNLIFNQPTTLVGMTAPAAYWDYSTSSAYVVNRYGGWGGITQGAAVLRVDNTAVTGNYSIRLNVFDNRPGGGQTASIDFTLTVTGGTAY